MNIIKNAVNKLGANSIGSFMNGIAPISKDNKFAFIDKDGKLLTAFSFDKCSNGYYMEQNYWTVIKNNLKGVINSNGKLIAECKYQYIVGGNGYLALYAKIKGYDNGGFEFENEKKAHCDIVNAETGEIVAKNVNYDKRREFLYNDKKEINPNVSSNKKYTHIFKYSEDMACAHTKEGNWVIIDLNGDIISYLPQGIYPYISNDVDPCDGCFHEGLLAIKTSNQKIGYANKFGEIVIPCQYYSAQRFSEGVAAVAIGDYKQHQWLYIDNKGERFLEPTENFFRVTNFKNGWAIGEIAHLRSPYDHYPQFLFNKQGKVLLSGPTGTLDRLLWYGKDCFKYNLFPVEKKEKNSTIYGFVDKNLDLVIPYQFSAAYLFKDEFSSVTGEKGSGIIDSYGNIVWLNE